MVRTDGALGFNSPADHRRPSLQRGLKSLGRARRNGSRPKPAMNFNELPGMKPGATWRNRTVGVAYVLVVLIVLGAVGGGGSSAESATSDPATAVPEPTEIEATATPDLRMSGAEARSLYETRMQEELREDGSDVTVDSVTGTDDTWQLRYTTYSTTEQGLLNEIASFAGGYSGVVSRSDVSPPDEMQVTIVNGYEGEDVATWHVRTSWVQSYQDGDMTDSEYLSRVVVTLETTSDSG